MYGTPKEIVILAANLLNARTKEILAYELPHFLQFVGKDIIDAKGRIKAKYDHERLEFPREMFTEYGGYGISTSYFLDYKYNKLNLSVTVCINGGSYEVKPNTAFTHYAKGSETILNAINNKLVDTVADRTLMNNEYDTTLDRSNLDKVYDFNEIQTKALELEILAAEYKMKLKQFPVIFYETFEVNRFER
jgi:hypothetical protein